MKSMSIKLPDELDRRRRLFSRERNANRSSFLLAKRMDVSTTSTRAKP